MNTQSQYDVDERCPCGAMTSIECSPITQENPNGVAETNHSFRFGNNAGSPSVLEDEPEIKDIFTRVDPDAWFMYANANDRNDPEPLVNELHTIIAEREDTHADSLTFWGSGYGFLQILFASFRPTTTVLIRGDFLGYRNAAIHAHKIYEAAATIPEYIAMIKLIQPEMVVFTDGETNPSLLPVSSIELTREVRAVSPNTIVVVDQAYGRHHGDSLEISKIALEDERTIFLRCASKDTGAVGVRLAWTITKPGGFADNIVKSMLTPYSVSCDVVRKAVSLYRKPDALNRVIKTQGLARKCLTALLRAVSYTHLTLPTKRIV